MSLSWLNKLIFIGRNFGVQPLKQWELYFEKKKQY